MKPPPSSPDYWHADGIDLWLNPRLTFDTSGLAEFLTDEIGIQSAVVLATSGTTGNPKFVVLEKSAMRASARAVNAHLHVTESDRWLAPLTFFHVGGLQIFTRAALSNCAVFSLRDPLAWDRTGAEFTAAISQNNISLTSLTPTHLHDIVAQKNTAPPSLRGLLVGGGSLSETLAAHAIELGWPIWPTYGMTESCSQIATATDPQAAFTSWLPILENWEIAPPAKIRGDALFSGYAVRDEKSGAWHFDRPFDADGWFQTADQIEISDTGREMRCLGRADDLVKSRGELVSLKKLEAALAEVGLNAVVFPIPDARLGHRFTAIIEGRIDAKTIADANEKLAPFEQVSEFHEIDHLPRTAVGKIDRQAVKRHFTNEQG